MAFLPLKGFSGLKSGGKKVCPTKRADGMELPLPKLSADGGGGAERGGRGSKMMLGWV